MGEDVDVAVWLRSFPPTHKVLGSDLLGRTLDTDLLLKTKLEFPYIKQRLCTFKCMHADIATCGILDRQGDNVCSPSSEYFQTQKFRYDARKHKNSGMSMHSHISVCAYVNKIP